MGYRYFICDVFTDTRFGGNPLAVVPVAAGLSDRQMQQIAREFNFSESTFVFPADHGHTRRVRIFTPTMEVPFAGHPNVGTAFVLAKAGEFGAIDGEIRVTFEEKAGLVPPRQGARTARSRRCSPRRARNPPAALRGASRRAWRWDAPACSRRGPRSGMERWSASGSAGTRCW